MDDDPNRQDAAPDAEGPQATPSLGLGQRADADLGRMPRWSEDWFNEVFEYHAPSDEQRRSYERIREAAKHFAGVVAANTPACADKSDAIRKIREAVMTANASIALRGLV